MKKEITVEKDHKKPHSEKRPMRERTTDRIINNIAKNPINGHRRARPNR